jgi:hypothetical protein
VALDIDLGTLDSKCVDQAVRAVGRRYASLAHFLLALHRDLALGRHLPLDRYELLGEIGVQRVDVDLAPLKEGAEVPVPLGSVRYGFQRR